MTIQIFLSLETQMWTLMKFQRQILYILATCSAEHDVRLASSAEDVSYPKMLKINIFGRTCWSATASHRETSKLAVTWHIFIESHSNLHEACLDWIGLDHIFNILINKLGTHQKCSYRFPLGPNCWSISWSSWLDVIWSSC